MSVTKGNMSIRKCQNCVTKGVSTVFYILKIIEARKSVITSDENLIAFLEPYLDRDQ